jgi:hypothetical protein
LLQATAAATIAWLIARHVVDHREPFFAPIAALVSLNTSLGERGRNALRLLLGVILGIGIGEVTVFALGGGYASIALATFSALALARLLGGARIVLAQAAIGAILTVAVANGQVGPQRLTDAMIGTAVALVFTQLLFTPHPLRLLRQVETDALTAMAAALELTAQTLDGNDSLADDAVASQRTLRDQLSELARMRKASARVARHSLVWRPQMVPLVRESEDAGHLDLLGGSCLFLTRAALSADEADRRLLAPSVRALSNTFSDLASQPGDRATRQLAVDRVLAVLREMHSADEPPAALLAARIAVFDLLMFAGVDPDEARAATRPEPREAPDVQVPAVTSTRRRRPDPLRRVRRWVARAQGRAVDAR